MASPHRTSPQQMLHSPSIYIIWGMFLVWITFFFGQLIELFRMPFSLRFVVSFIAILVFFALYIDTSHTYALHWTSDTPTTTLATRHTWGRIIVMLLLSLFLALVDGYAWGGLFIYTSAIAASHLSLRSGIAVVTGLAVMPILGAWLVGIGWQSVGGSIFTIPVTGFSTMALTWALTTNRDLRIARKELAQMAVTEERLRFARDLHDLLGHTLSLIALKSELAGRLVLRAPERAQAEISDIESAARQALQEVREAVAGYRQPTLRGELQGARELLDAAGICYAFAEEGMAIPLPSPTEAMLAWTVREGVTNVIKHSHGQHCTINLSHRDDDVMLTISDDGHVEPADTPSAAGNGLRGLAERAKDLGGSCATEHNALGGFRLTVIVPHASTPQRLLATAVREGQQQ